MNDKKDGTKGVLKLRGNRLFMDAMMDAVETPRKCPGTLWRMHFL